MIAPRPRRHGYLLVELLLVIAIAAILLTIMGKLILDAIYLQRIATQHLHRMAQIEQAVETMRRDACAALASGWETDGESARLTLVNETDPARETIEYRIEAARISRWERGRQSHAWEAPRLTFRGGFETGATHGLFVLTCEERPPPRATTLPLRTFEISVLTPIDATAKPADTLGDES